MENKMNKKRICIITYGNMYLYPFVGLYVNQILAAGAECSFLYWNRYEGGKEKDMQIYPSCTYFSYDYVMPIRPGGQYKKLIQYIKASLYMKKTLKEQKFDGLILIDGLSVLTFPNTFFKLYGYKYITDIRDYSNLNKYYVIRWLTNKLFKYASKVVISSPAYKVFLPQADFVISHNYMEFPSTQVHKIVNREYTKLPITISYVGTVRYYDMDMKILNLFANDDRFKICYYGSGSEYLENYTKQKGINNVDFHGGFMTNETCKFYEQTSLINNLYGNHNPNLDYALSNKLYHAAQLHIPILVCPDTYMEKVSLQYNMGIVVDVNDSNTADKLYQAYKNFDWESFHEGCEKFLTLVKNENTTFEKVINDFAK